MLEYNGDHNDLLQGGMVLVYIIQVSCELNSYTVDHEFVEQAYICR